MARPGGATATPVTGDPGAQRGPPPAPYTSGGHQWGSELEIPWKGRHSTQSYQSLHPLSCPGAQRDTHLPLASPEWAWRAPRLAQRGQLSLWGRRRGAGGSGNRTLRPLWQALTRASLTRSCHQGSPCPEKLGPRLQAGPQPLLQAEGSGTQLLTPPTSCQREVLPHPIMGSMVYLFSPAHPQPRRCPGPGAPSLPPLPPPVLSCPLFIYWAGGGVRAQAEEIPHVLRQGGVTVPLVCPPSPGWG